MSKSFLYCHNVMEKNSSKKFHLVDFQKSHTIPCGEDPSQFEISLVERHRGQLARGPDCIQFFPLKINLIFHA